MRPHWLERGLIALLGVVILWQGWQQASLRGQLREVEGRMVEAELELTALGEAQRVGRLTAPSADMFRQPSADLERSDPPLGRIGARRAPQARPAAVGDAPDPQLAEARAMARESEEVPGARMLAVLYEAADTVAVEQGWEPQTYDEVTRVFEKAMATMGDLVARTRDGEFSRPEARRRALYARDRATEDLVDILGEDGFARLRDEFVEDLPTPPRRR